MRFLIAALAWLGLASSTAPIPVPVDVQTLRKHSPLRPPAPDPSNRFRDDPNAATLGRVLFFDRGLSRSGKMACASCHDPQKGWTDGRATPQGVSRNTPTLWNAVYQRWLFWDGRSDSLWSQALSPIEDPAEMGFSRLEVAHHLARTPDLARLYEASFGALPRMNDSASFPERARPWPADPKHPENKAWLAMRPEDRTAVDRVFANVGKALAAFESTIVSPEAPFDTYVQGVISGDQRRMAVMSRDALNGMSLFFGVAQCSVCHTGPTFSDGEFHDLGVPGPLDSGRQTGVERVKAASFGLISPFSDDSTGASGLRVRLVRRGVDLAGRFRTPTLRNLVYTAPYMHRGQFATLEEVVRFYSTQAGTRGGNHEFVHPLRLGPVDERGLVAFLQSLSAPAAIPAPH